MLSNPVDCSEIKNCVDCPRFGENCDGDIRAKICDNYCRKPIECTEEELKRICECCPLDLI